MSWLIFWIGALATYRLTVLIARDLGPFQLFKKLRAVHTLSKWAKCTFCVSPYAAAIVAITLVFSGSQQPFALWILTALSWSAIAIALDRTFSADYSP